MSPVEPDLMLRVAGYRSAAEHVVELILARADGRLLPEWAPGAHVDLLFSNGVIRQYSLAGSPRDRSHWRLGILRERNSRGGSEFVHTRLSPGDVIRARGPRNNFQLVAASRYIFIAGGIGITPLLPMTASAHEAGADWLLLYGGRTRASMAFCEELACYGSRVAFRPEDQFGLLDLKSVLGRPQNDTAIYCCGPEPLIAAVEKASADWPEGALHVERFSAQADARSGESSAFEVELRRSGMILQVPYDRSILEIVTEAGIPVLSSCEDGICGTCQTAVIEGVPDHRDSILSEAEKKSCRTMAICVSRAVSPRLVLDL
jgi:ferredoxin-NADP reductase